MRLWDKPLPMQTKPSVPVRNKKNMFTIKQVKEALAFYKNDYESWAGPKGKKALKNIKSFEMLIFKYRGADLSELSLRFRMNDWCVTQALRQTEARVETYLKLKEVGRADN